MPRAAAVLCTALLAGFATYLFSTVRVPATPHRPTIESTALPLRPLDPENPVPVVVELFTSEGCSSCPSADEVLIRLVTTQPVAGAHVIGLGEHVHYWDRLGWRDPFSSKAFTARQSEYAYLFGNSRIYTPQMVVDGREEFLGSDYRRAIDAIARAAQAAKATMHLSVTAWPGRLARVKVEGLTGPADIFLAVTEADLSNDVERGENRGRRLEHGTVVRQLERIGVAAPRTQPWTTTRLLSLRPDWVVSNLQVVAFAQAEGSRRIVASAVSRVP